MASPTGFSHRGHLLQGCLLVWLASLGSTGAQSCDGVFTSTWWCGLADGCGLTREDQTRITYGGGVWLYDGASIGIGRGESTDACDTSTLYCAGGSSTPPTFGWGADQVCAAKEAVDSGGWHPGAPVQWGAAALAFDPCANAVRNAPPSQQDLETPGRFQEQACSVTKISQLVSEQDVNQERDTVAYVESAAALSNFKFNPAHEAMFAKLLRAKVGGGRGIPQLSRVVGNLDVLDADGLDALLVPGITIPNWGALRLAYSSSELRRGIPDLVRKDAPSGAATTSPQQSASAIALALMRLGDAVKHNNGPPVSRSAPPSAAIAPPSALLGSSSSQEVSSDDDFVEVHYRAKKSVSGKARSSQFTTYQQGKPFRSATDGDAKRRALYPPEKWCFVVSDADVFGYIKMSHLEAVMKRVTENERNPKAKNGKKY